MEQQALGRKTKDDHRIHFKERLNERYGLLITDELYETLPSQFTGLFTKQHRRTIGYVELDGKRVWCLYYKKLECMPTVYPPDIATDPYSLMRACFGERLVPLATMVYEAYRKEAANIDKEFDSLKEAAICFFKHTLFPTLHIEEYKNGDVPIFKIMQQIKNIVYGKSPYVELKLSKKEKPFPDV